MTSASVNTTLAEDDTALFYIVPTTTGSYILFTMTLCQSVSTAEFTFTLWAEGGNIDTFTDGTAFSGPTTLTLGTGCVQVTTPYINFGTQPNGEIELLIVGI